MKFTARFLLAEMKNTFVQFTNIIYYETNKCKKSELFPSIIAIPSIALRSFIQRRIMQHFWRDSEMWNPPVIYVCQAAREPLTETARGWNKETATASISH